MSMSKGTGLILVKRPLVKLAKFASQGMASLAWSVEVWSHGLRPERAWSYRAWSVGRALDGRLCLIEGSFC